MGFVDVPEQRGKQTNSVFERIYGDVLAHIANTMPVEAVEWFRCNLDYNVSDERRNNVMSVAEFVQILRGRTLSDDEYFKAMLLEWCIKLLQASRSYVYPDDKPNTQRKQQYWQAGDDVFVKDSLWLSSVTFYLLKKYFCMETYYVHLLELFHETAFQTEVGHLVKCVIASKDHFDLGKFTLQKYALITRNRITSYYLPVALAMCVCGIPENYTLHGCLFYPYAIARSILLQLGEYSQIQDDYLSYTIMAGEVSKTNSGVTESKCSWCINVALIVSSPEQRKVLEENYGQTDPEKQMRVKQIYDIIGLRERYWVYESKLKERIETLILEIPEPEEDVNVGVLKREVFSRFFNEIYKRTN